MIPATKEEIEVWKELIEWLATQDGFIMIGVKDNEVAAKASVGLDDAYEMVSLIEEMLADSLESGEKPSGFLQ